MTRAAVSVLVFACYLLVLGAWLVVAPNPLLALFGLPPVSDAWIRVAGMLVLVLAYYYARAARLELTPLFTFSVHARCGVMVFFIGFVGAGLLPPIALLFGAADLAGAIWTWRALGSRTAPSVP